MKKVFGIGNPLIDVAVKVTDSDLNSLSLHKGIMDLINEERQKELISFIKDKPVIYNCGGSCPNTIIALSSMGVEATLAGMVGTDMLGDKYISRLEELGAGNQLARTERMPTGTSIILLTEDGERTMNTFLGANRLYGSENVNTELLSSFDIFHFTGYMWDTENQKASVRKAIETMKAAGKMVTFDIADPFAVARYRSSFIELIKDSCDIVFANKEEARILASKYEASECCREIGKICRTAVVKNGKKGSYICHEGKVTVVPVSGLVSPVDTTGAGDVYAAGFLYGLCNNLPLEKCGRIASYLAGEIISQIGAQFSKERAAELKIKLRTIAEE